MTVKEREVRAAAREEAARVLEECAWAIDAGTITPTEAIGRITEAFDLYVAATKPLGAPAAGQDHFR